ncbi:MAG TPA: hypothetical protein VMS56_01130 [Thermoanaerobaculia bacterium]|nr:hypothetical protein [Thermoanaerobaculia bacterium]
MRHPALKSVTAALVLLGGLGGSAAATTAAYEKVLREIEKQTGLTRSEIPGAEGEYLGKTHRGYRVIYTAKAGNVWGRYAARLTMGEIGREVGGVLGYLTGQRHSGGTIVGSPLDRLLSEIIGQPLSVTILLDHGKPDAPRLDIVSGYSPLARDEELPEQARISRRAGAIYSNDAELAARLTSNKALMKRMKSLRCQFIRVDGEAVAFLWAGSETDYSGMINDHGGYYRMLNALMDDLADIADAIPATTPAP